MPRARRPRSPLRHALVAALALGATVATGVAAAGGGGHPALAGDIVETRVFTATTLEVEPGGRTAPGVVVTLVATVVDEDGLPLDGQLVSFRLDGVVVADGVLDDEGRAEATVAPAQGAHTVEARFQGPGNDGRDLLGSSDAQDHSVLPATCPDGAHPGAGAVVRHAYLVALHRCPDPAGSAYWVARLDGGAPAGAVASALARSAEAVDMVVDDAYRRILGRPADAAGRAGWAARLRAGWTTSKLWAALAASPEFAAGTDGPAPLVARAFARIVERSADPAGAAYWQARLASGPRWATWRALAVTAEVVDGVVADAHQSALGRAPSPSEADAARATIRSRRGDWRLLAAEVLGRPEAATHAQRYPDPVADA